MLIYWLKTKIKQKQIKSNIRNNEEITPTSRQIYCFRDVIRCHAEKLRVVQIKLTWLEWTSVLVPLSFFCVLVCPASLRPASQDRFFQLDLWPESIAYGDDNVVNIICSGASCPVRLLKGNLRYLQKVSPIRFVFCMANCFKYPHSCLVNAPWVPLML